MWLYATKGTVEFLKSDCHKLEVLAPLDIRQNQKLTAENTAATKTARNYVDCQDTFRVQATLLQTAICVISNPLYPERETKVRVLLDQGSQRQLKEKLNLPVLGKENMIIKTFGAGSNEDSITVCDDASMKIKNPKSGFSIDLSRIPF